MSSSPPPDLATEAPGVALPRVSRLAIGALALIVVSLLFALIELIFGFEVQPALALPGVLGLILAHVAWFRIRAKSGMLSGFGFAASALAIGYAALFIGTASYGLYYLLMSNVGD